MERMTSCTTTKRLFSISLHTCVLLLLAIIVLNFSPFGTSDRADKYSQDIFNNLLSKLIYPTDARDDIAVLLLTDEGLERHQQGVWPARYDFHGQVLNQLLIYQPKAVFIDMLWMNMDKPGSSYLVRVLERYRDKKIPVFVVAISPSRFEQMWPELIGLVTPVSAFVDIDRTDFVARSYPSQHGALNSAAFALAHALDIFPQSHKPLKTMDIFWSSVDNSFNEWLTEPSSAEAPSLIGTITQGFTDVNLNHPYHNTLVVRDLLSAVNQNDEDTWQMAESILTNRVVFYGANLTGVQDFVFTPNRDILPGVYYHSMAFDNLITWGEDYKSHQTGHPIFFIQILVVLPIILLAVFNQHQLIGKQRLCDITFDLSNRQTAKSTFGKFFIITCSIFICLFFWSLFWAWILFEFFNASAASWLSFFEVLSYGFIISKLELISKIENLIFNKEGTI